MGAGERGGGVAARWRRQLAALWVLQDLTATMWRDDEWLKFYPLNAHTAIDYFSLSTFYDMSCSNEKAKLQGLQPSAIPCAAHPPPPPPSPPTPPL